MAEARFQFQRGVELARTLPDSASRDNLELDLLTDLGSVVYALEGSGDPGLQDVYDRDFLGLDVGSGDGSTPQPPEKRPTLLPEPRGPGERNQPPWPFLAMTALAAALVVSGAGSSIYRRVHR